ncbi:hypothetical protein LCGC14_1201010 [marine sediment metagenome]|uniref:Type III pantothenate kinase n=1 Tax=marine sediment metagenome TaxID=412755 RepID=A0A0F9M483_9ZZZZ
MNLTIDVGNTLVKVGLFKKRKLILNGEFATHPRKEIDEWGILLSQWTKNCQEKVTIEKAVISSVVSSIFAPLKRAVEKYFRVPSFEVKGDKIGVPILCDNPAEVGADRIANVVAASELYKLPAIVIDFGTATTFDVISKKGEYLGGVIAPGVRCNIESLAEKAEALFAVELRKPAGVIGKNTRNSLVSGIFYYSLGGIKQIIKEIKEELREKTEVIATGGLGILLAQECEEIDDVNPILTLEGLNLIGEKWA